MAERPIPDIDLKSLGIRLQPKQQKLLDALESVGDVPTVWGMGGSRGSAKSGGIRRIAIILALKYPAIRIFIVRRVLADLMLNHVYEMQLEYPTVHDLYRPPSGGKRPEYAFSNDSKIILLYAETAADVDRLVKGQQAAFVLIDQAEQFAEKELIAFREINRAPGVPEGFCKIVFFFNTAQGIGAGYFRRVFHVAPQDPTLYNPNERPATYGFIQVYSWDNHKWFEGQTPHTFEEIYALSSEERFDIYIRDTSQGRKQNELPEPKRSADLLGNFDAFSGQYFADVWGKRCVVDSSVAAEIVKPWWTHWMAQRWGFGDHDCHVWAATGFLSPNEWAAWFGGKASAPIEAIVIYRELLTTGRAEAALALDIANLTPEVERPSISAFYLGNEAMDQAKKRGENTIGEAFGAIMKRYGLPAPLPADTHRVDGWRFMHGCLRQSELREMAVVDAERAAQGPILLISSSCKKLIEGVPLAAREERGDPNDILQLPGEWWCSVTDAVRYLLKSKPAAKRTPPSAVRRKAVYDSYSDPTDKHMAMLRFDEDEKRHGRAIRSPNWRQP